MRYIYVSLLVLLFLSIIYLRYIYPTPYLSQPKINELYRTMNNTDKILTENNIRYFISCGTLLGSVRDGGLIPWDNDIDICIFTEDLDKFLALEPQFKAVDNSFNYADDIHRINGNIPGIWIDVFLYSKNDKGIYHHELEKNRTRFSKEYLYEDELFPLKKTYIFGNTVLYGPQKEEIFLRRLYGNNWKTPIQYSKMGGFLAFLKYKKIENKKVALPSK